LLAHSPTKIMLYALASAALALTAGPMGRPAVVSRMPIVDMVATASPTTIGTGVVVPTNMNMGLSPVIVGGEKVMVRKGASGGLSELANSPLTEEDVLECQRKWAGAIAAASKVYSEGGDYIGAAADAANELYGYGHTQVLFKPTKAAEFPFRPTAADAMSYFVGGSVVEGGYEEDAGFAINGGKGWDAVEFYNHGIALNGMTATAMGYYLFTDASSKAKVRVEYTFGYKRCADGKPRIYLHHSSVPYAAAPAAPALADVTEAEVLECQAKWAAAIKGCSKVYLEDGDYIGAAADAAAELYGYGHSQVLFKPTKAAEFPFRPTGGEAMSYFVGGSAVEGGYTEDAGFAINGGKGWKDVVFTNHNIELLGPAAVAMGSYVFTCATTGDKVKVEYTFGYKRNDDGKARIFLHHSSVPYKA